MADNLAVGELGLAAAGLSALLAFLAGAACTAVLVNWGRRRRMESEYAFPLMVEAGLLLCFGLMGSRFEQHRWLLVSATVGLMYWNRREHTGQQAVRADRSNLWLLTSLVGLFFIGGVTGAIGFKHVGFVVTVPLAAMLMLLAVVPVMDDLRELR